MAMTKEQITHLTKRINEIYNEKFTDLQKIRYKKPVEKAYPVAELIQKIKNDELVAKVDEEWGYHDGVLTKISQFGSFLELVNKQPKVVVGTYEEKVKKLKSEKDRILDELIFGDAEEAVKLLAGFREFEV